MALLEINKDQHVKRGSGGMFGKIGAMAGTLLGGIAGSVVPGVGTMAGAAAGAALGGTVGGLGGQALDTPDKMNNTNHVGQIHAAANLPEVQFATLNDAKKSLYQSDQFSAPQKDSLASIYDQAQQALKKSIEMSRTV